MEIDDLKFDQLVKMIEGRFDEVDRSQGEIKKLVGKIHKTEMARSAKQEKVTNGHAYLENHDLCELLGVTKRSLQRYRQYNKIAFNRTTMGKCYYRSDDVKEFIKRYPCKIDVEKIKKNKKLKHLLED